MARGPKLVSAHLHPRP